MSRVGDRLFRNEKFDKKYNCMGEHHLLEVVQKDPVI